LYSDCLPGTEPFPDAEDSNKTCLPHGYREGKLADYGGVHSFTCEGVSPLCQSSILSVQNVIGDVLMSILPTFSEELRELSGMPVN